MLYLLLLQWNRFCNKWQILDGIVLWYHKIFFFGGWCSFILCLKNACEQYLNITTGSSIGELIIILPITIPLHPHKKDQKDVNLMVQIIIKFCWHALKIINVKYWSKIIIFIQNNYKSSSHKTFNIAFMKFSLKNQINNFWIGSIIKSI